MAECNPTAAAADDEWRRCCAPPFAALRAEASDVDAGCVADVNSSRWKTLVAGWLSARPKSAKVDPKGPRSTAGRGGAAEGGAATAQVAPDSEDGVCAALRGASAAPTDRRALRFDRCRRKSCRSAKLDGRSPQADVAALAPPPAAAAAAEDTSGGCVPAAAEEVRGGSGQLWLEWCTPLNGGNGVVAACCDACGA